MHDEEIIAVRKVRHEISEECGHDVHKVAAYYRTAGKRLRALSELRPEKTECEKRTLADPAKNN
jgi:hypothetical protein